MNLIAQSFSNPQCLHLCSTAAIGNSMTALGALSSLQSLDIDGCTAATHASLPTALEGMLSLRELRVWPSGAFMHPSGCEVLMGQAFWEALVHGCLLAGNQLSKLWVVADAHREFGSLAQLTSLTHLSQQAARSPRNRRHAPNLHWAR